MTLHSASMLYFKAVNTIVMVNASVIPHTYVSQGFASETSDKTSYCTASVDCGVSTSAAAPDIALMLISYSSAA